MWKIILIGSSHNTLGSLCFATDEDVCAVENCCNTLSKCVYNLHEEIFCLIEYYVWYILHLIFFFYIYCLYAKDFYYINKCIFLASIDWGELRTQTHIQEELLILPEHLSSPPVFIGVRVTRSLVLCMFCISLFFCSFSFGHCVVCTSSIYGFWLSLWHLFSKTFNTVYDPQNESQKFWPTRTPQNPGVGSGVPEG
jgi:uncharacterized membrane protein